jgi:hypothetical protein
MDSEELQVEAYESERRLHESVTCNSLSQRVHTCYDIICCTGGKLELEMLDERIMTRTWDSEIWKAEAKELSNSRFTSVEEACIHREDWSLQEHCY